MYIICLICKSRFIDLDFFIWDKSAIGKIPITMIFMNKIDIGKYLQSRLFLNRFRTKEIWNILYIYF